MGFKQTSGDPCLYVHFDSEGELFLVAVYVDGIVLGGRSGAKMNAVKNDLSHKFKMKDLGLSEMVDVRMTDHEKGRKQGVACLFSQIQHLSY